MSYIETETTDDFTADDVLIAASAELDERGMTREVLIDHYGRVCALGALMAGVARLRHETCGVEDAVTLYWDAPAFGQARDACTRALGGTPDEAVRGLTIAEYNNHQAEGPEDLHRLFEKARKILAEEATTP